MAYFSYKGKGGVAPQAGPQDLRDIVRTVPMTGAWYVPSLDTAIVAGTPDWTTVEFVDEEGQTFGALPSSPLFDTDESTRIARAALNKGLWRVSSNLSAAPTVRFIPYAGFIGTVTAYWRVKIDGVTSKWGALQVNIIDTIFAPDKITWQLGNNITWEQYNVEVAPTLEHVAKFFSALVRNTPGFQQNGMTIRVHRTGNISEVFAGYENALAAAGPTLYNPDGKTVREGSLYYATEYLDDLKYGRQDIENAMLHEVSHIFGVSGGDMNPGRYSVDQTKYYGPNTRNSFNLISGLNLDHTPVAAKWHWDVPAGIHPFDYTRHNDTMISRLRYAEAPAFSRISGSMLQDMGWSVDTNLLSQLQFIDDPDAPFDKPYGGQATGILGSSLSGAGTGGGTAVGLVPTTPQRAPYLVNNDAYPTINVPDTLDLTTYFVAGDSPIDWTSLFILDLTRTRSTQINYGTTNYVGTNASGAAPYQFSVSLNTPGIITTAVNPGGNNGDFMLFRVFVRDTAGRLSQPLNVWIVDTNTPTGPPLYSGPPSTIAGPTRVPYGSSFTVSAEIGTPVSLQLQGSPDGINWSNRQAPTAVSTTHNWNITASPGGDIRFRTSVVNPSTPTFSGTHTVEYEQTRLTGIPTSSNNASSFHIDFGNSPISLATSAAIDLTVTAPGSDPSFWAFQTDFVDAGGNLVAGAHIGLQIWPGYPSNKAVNWGGYNVSTGFELDGSVSALPSATGNPNTRNFLWTTGEKYRLIVIRSSVGVWSGWITQVSTGTSTLIRDLYVPNGHYINNYLYCWNESFSACDGGIKTATWQRPRLANDTGGLWQPTSGFLSYQSYVNGGCTNANTSVAPGGIGWVQQTGGTRVNHHGQWLAAPNTHA